MKSWSESPQGITRQQAAKELLTRRRARASLVDYAQAIEIPGAPVSEDPDEWLFKPVESGVAAHHVLMMRAIERTMTTPMGRLMIFMPPGSAKSTYAGVVAPSWYMGKFPRSRIIMASYGTDLARKHGRKTRQIVRSKRFASVFATTVSKDVSAADEWQLTNGSEYMAGGLLSGLTGNRANGIIIDDPIRGRRDADSDTVRKSTMDAYNDDLKTRLLPDGWIILVQTRWHEDDLAGQILPAGYNGESGAIHCRDGATWNVICLAAQCERHDDPLGRKIGEYLWPEWFPEQHWEMFKTQQRTWSALYQQRPAPAEGTFFKLKWFTRYESMPANQNIYITGDFAVTQDGGDFTEIAVWGVDRANQVRCLEWWSGQTSSDVWTDVILDLAQKYKNVIRFIGEQGPIRKAVEPFLLKRMRERGVFVACEWLPTAGEKEANCASFQAMCSTGQVTFPDAPWANRVIDQLLRFPAGSHDDCVDACGLFGRYIAKVWAAPKPIEPPKTLEEAWNKPLTFNDLTRNARR